MLEWGATQQFALNALNFKRWVLRSEFNEQHEPKQTTVNRANIQALQDLIDDLTNNCQESENTVDVSHTYEIELNANNFYTFSQADIKLRCDENYSLLTCERLRFDWLLPPITGFRGNLSLLAPSDAEFLLLALERSGLAEEASVLKEILAQPIGVPFGKVPLPFSNKRLVTLGAAAARVASGIHLFHPQYVYENPWHKRLLWLQILQLQDI